jgi:hypothetical protein
MAEATIEQLVDGYIKLRDKKEELEAAHKAKLHTINVFMEDIEHQIAAKSLVDGVDSYKTAYGTAFFSSINRCNVSDWNQTLQFIVQNGAYDMLNKAVKKDVVRDYIEKYGVVPPGLDWATIRTFNCRKPTKD